MRLGVFAAMQINRMNRILFPLIGQFKHSPPDVSPPLFTDQSEGTKCDSCDLFASPRTHPFSTAIQRKEITLSLDVNKKKKMKKNYGIQVGKRERFSHLKLQYVKLNF